MDRRIDRVVALAGVLDHLVGTVVDEVGVVSGAAAHDVGAAVAIEDIVAAVAVERIDQGVAVALQVGAALQEKILHVRRQPEMGRGIDCVVALASVLGHLVASIVNDIDVVADQSHEDVGAAAAVDEIVAGVAVDDVRQAVAVALQVGDPERSRFSTLSGRLKCVNANTRSMPSPAFSITASPPS
jgi:hypothetical protein